MRAPSVIAFVMLMPALGGAVTPVEAAAGWLDLFDGETLFGWTSESAGKWKAGNGVLTSDSDAGGVLRSNAAFADFMLRCDFRVNAGGRGGIFLRWEKHDKSEESGYSLQIDDRNGEYPTGSLMDILKATPTATPRPGEWRNLQLFANADHFVVQLDGVTVLDGKDGRFRTGYIRLQSRPGSRLELRNLRLKPLGIDSLFNGSDLAGWKQVPPPPSKPSKLSKLNPLKSKPKPALWAAEQGLIRVQDGPDQLETEKNFGDFILQLQVRVTARDNKRHPEGAIFFRGDPSKYQSGYKLLIHNDANSPTGTLSALQPARRPIGQDNHFSTETIAAYGRHFAVWVDGVLVNDYDDRRPDGIARTGPGAVALSHEPDSVLDFRNIGVESLPKAVMATEVPKHDSSSPSGTAAPVTTLGSPAAPPSAPVQPPFPSSVTAPPGQAAAQAEDNARRAKISELTGRSLQASDPEEQVRINTEILKLDPANQVAYNALQSAQEKIEKNKALRAERDSAAKQRDDQSQTAESMRREALRRAEDALVAGNLKGAADELAIVRKISPGNPEALVLSARVNQRIQDRKRLAYTVAGGALAGLGVVVALIWMSRGKKCAYVEITSGMDQGKRFDFTGDVLHIGAIEQDGTGKNEVVVHDADRMISRFHCEIHRRGQKFYLFDLKSANGTFVDGRRIKPGKPARVKSGTRIDLAGVSSIRLGYSRKGTKNSG